eukprot:m.69211 g.69211  ORF g.69211 m.69211 type:complete len:157 (-) comp7797_c0_seq1:460-930(-)
MAGVSAFPPPPAYFAQYTAEATADSAARLLQPPAIPAEPHSVFGIVTDENAPLLPSLEDQQQVRLYAAGDDIDHVAELHKLNRMLVGKFIELNDTLSDRPDDATVIDCRSSGKEGAEGFSTVQGRGWLTHKLVAPRASATPCSNASTRSSSICIIS